MAYRTLGDVVADLEARGELKRASVPVDPVIEVTETCQRSLRAGGAALLFERPRGLAIPLLGNLFGSTQRVARALGRQSVAEPREVGQMPAFLPEPQVRRKLRARGFEIDPGFPPAPVFQSGPPGQRAVPRVGPADFDERGK